MDLTPDTPIRFVPRVGPMMAERLIRLGITRVGDLLYHIPFRYDDFSLVSNIRDIHPDDTVTIRGVVHSFSAFATKTGKRMQQAIVMDDTGKVPVVWFNQPFLRSIITVGSTIRLSGTISWFAGKLVMNSPQYEMITSEGESLHTGRIVPVYPETEGISSKWLRGRIDFLLEILLPTLPDVLPKSIKTKYHLLDLSNALATIHFPKNLNDVEAARKRLGFDELFLLQLIAYERKRERISTNASYPFLLHETDVATLIGTLPFTLTDDQKRSIEEIFSDLIKPTPMNRLLEGDVGSGKTVVAAIALYEAYRNGCQSAIMAPTQILAEQHYLTIKTLLEPLGITVALATGSTKLKNPADITIGTHAILSESLIFKKLGLLVVDEQQRFGVEQRSRLTQKNSEGKIPHLLTMTATPIPRTLAKTVFGSLDLSRLSQMPKGRKKVKTWVVPEEKRKAAYQWIGKELQSVKAQAFIICPLIEDSENLTDVKAVKSEYERLKTKFPNFSLGLLHGKLTPKEKTEVLSNFRAKKFDILVATPVVEVGIDIPNATIMLIEAADRFGLGQLHQLRGRVGRGDLASYCILFTQSTAEKTMKRLKSMEIVYDGAELAQIDLELRGPGDLFGSRQHGLTQLKVASYMDLDTVNDTYTAVSDITKHDPELTNLPLLRELLKKSKIDTIVAD